MFACLLVPARPFTLHISEGLFADDTLADLAASISARQLQGVSLRVEEQDEDDFLEMYEGDGSEGGDSDGEEEEEDEQGGDSEGEDWGWEVPDE
jgi:hypothetical protein